MGPPAQHLPACGGVVVQAAVGIQSDIGSQPGHLGQQLLAQAHAVGMGKVAPVAAQQSLQLLHICQTHLCKILMLLVLPAVARQCSITRRRTRRWWAHTT